MASFQIATKANLASLLPTLSIANYLQRELQPSLTTISKSFHDGLTLPNLEVIQMTCDDGKTWFGKSIVRYLAELASSHDGDSEPQHARSVCTQSCEFRMLTEHLRIDSRMD